MTNTSGIARDGSKNKVNWNFGELLLKVNDKTPIPVSLVNVFHSIAQGIAHKKHWFHPAGKGEWNSLANDVIATQICRLNDLDREEIIKQRESGRYAYIYRALKYRMIDEIRRIIRRPHEVHLPIEKASPTPLVELAAHPDVALQRENTRLLISTAKQHFAQKKLVPAFLSEIEGFLDDDNETNNRAHLITKIAETRNITRQHARRLLIQFQDQTKADDRLQEIRTALCGTRSLLEQQWPVYPSR